MNYLIYNTEEEANARADIEGARRKYAYHRGYPDGTRYHTSAELTADNKYALKVNAYDLTTEEESAIVTNVTFPEVD